MRAWFAIYLASLAALLVIVLAFRDEPWVWLVIVVGILGCLVLVNRLTGLLAPPMRARDEDEPVLCVEAE